jgi:hypothetical protein
MNESTNTPSKNGSPRSDSSDRQMLAHVEKWMAVIREISNARGK